MAGLSIISSKFVTLALTKELAGHYNSAYGFLQIFGILADFGLYAVAVREMARAHDRSRVLGAMIVLRGGILLMSLGLAISIAWILPQSAGTPFPYAVMVAACVPLLTLMAGMLRSVFQVEYQLHYVFFAEVLQRIVSTSLIGMFVYLGYRGSSEVWVLEALLWSGVAGAAVLLLISIVYSSRFVRLRLTLDRALILHMLKLAAPYGIAYLCMAFYRQMDVMFITMLRSDFALQNAYYGIAARAKDMAFILPTFLLNSVLPFLSQRDSESPAIRSLLSRTLFIIMFMGIEFFLFSLLWAKPLTLLLSTPAYLATPLHPGTDQAFAFMSLVLLLNGFVMYSFYVLLAHDDWHRLTATLAASAVISVLLHLWLVPLYGFFGSCIAQIVVHAPLILFLLPRALRLQPIHITRRQIRSLAFLSLPLAPILWLMAPYLTTGPLVLGGGLVVGCIMLVLAWLGDVRGALAK